VSDDTRIEVELVLDNKGVDKPLKDSEKKIGDSGKKAGEKFDKGFRAGMGPLVATVAAVGSALAGAFAVGKVVDAANQQEDAINRLNTSLKLTGQYSKETSQDLQNFASQLQANSTVGDEVILENMGLLQSLGRLSSEGLKPATQAALDMSAALGVDLSTATTMVAKAANGNISTFQRYGIEIQKGKDNAETFANTLDALSSRFGGAAASKVNTFSGSMTQLNNVFGDLLEEVGFLITRSPALVAVFKFISEQITSAIGLVKDLGSQGDALKPIILAIIDFAEAVNTFIVVPLEMAYNVVKFAFNMIVAEINGYVALVGQALGKVADLANKAGIDNELTRGLQAFRESSSEVFTESVQDAHNAFDQIFDFKVAEKSATFLEGLRTAVEEAKEITDEGGRSMAGNLNNPMEEVAQSLPYTFENIFQGIKTTMTTFESSVQAFSKKVGSMLMQGLGGSAANAFAAFGRAAAEGDNMMKAFINSFLASMGQMAVQLGAMFIMEGAAMTFAGLANGPSLMAAGAALAAFGGVMGALFGGSAGTAGGGVAVGSPGTSPGNPVFTDPAAAQVRQEPETSISLTVQGDVLDSDETGMRLVSLLNENFSAKGGRLTGGFA
jgi:hypothetical protein